MNIKKKFKHFAENCHRVFEGLKGGPFEHTKNFLHKMFLFCFSILKKNVFDTNSELLSQKYTRSKIKRNI